MPLVPAVCPNCKGTLEVNPAQDAAICRFCGTPFIVEKAINQYNTTNNFNANVINYYASDNSDFVIRGGVLEKYNGASTEVMIPNGVIEVKPDVFRGTYVRSISLPSSIKVICLLDCPSLSIIQIPVSVHIKMLSIIGCDALKNIVLNGVIEELNINNCNNLSDIPLRSNIKSISIRNCEKLTNIVIPQDVKSLRLTLSRLKSINLPEGIKSISFSGCTNLNSIIIPNSVDTIEAYDFCDCSSLTNVKITNPSTRILDFTNDIWNEEIGGAFSGCSNLVKVDLPYNIPYIEKYAFSGCLQLHFRTKYYICHRGFMSLTLAGKLKGLKLVH